MKQKSLSTIVILILSTVGYTQTFTNTDSVPVRVSFFNATSSSNNKTKLDWKVVCFLQFANFEVQRSMDGKDYTTINTFTADRIRCQLPFDFEDATQSGRTFYRLKVGNIDGNFATSKVIVAFGKEKSFEINSITPSLVKSNTVLSVSSSKSDNATVTVNSYSGLVVKRISMSLAKGVTDIKLSLNELAKGNYILVVSTTSEVKSMRFAKL